MPGVNGCDLADLLKRMRPELKIILHSGTSDIPQNEMTSIDTFVSKTDGIPALIAEVAELTHVVMGVAYCVGAQYRLRATLKLWLRRESRSPLVFFPYSIPVLFPAPSLFAPCYELAPSARRTVKRPMKLTY
jgi:hypothetical protein